MSTEKDIFKFPKLRDDLKISKMVNKNTTSYVIKDPLKENYFRFSEDEWKIIELFDGQGTIEDIVKRYNEKYTDEEIDFETIKAYREDLENDNILQKSKKDMNVMLVEKVKEMREVQLLSKKGSLMYKRFPIIDPDKMFDKYIPYLKWIWSKQFFIFSSLVMLGAVIIIFSNWARFNEGMQHLFSFSEMSIANMIMLWFVVYGTIALHEFGHGLTCKYYGGEVHEIGFLLLFFQPCLYCNVNDAWLFDKKWKQVMVTVAGGYVEFFIGSICAYIWVLTAPNTFINTLSFQVMTICSVSTVLFNFNPLVKLDGYYLFSDFTEIPNLKEESANYLKYIVAKYIFKMPRETWQASKREKRILFGYGLAGFIWISLLLTGLVGMAKGILVEKFHFGGIIITGWIAYKLFGGHVKKSGSFLKEVLTYHRSKLNTPKFKRFTAAGAVFLIILLAFPFNYKIKGECELKAYDTRVLRAEVDGVLQEFHKKDGEAVSNKDHIATLDNFNVSYGRKIAMLDLEKSKIKMRKTLLNTPEKINESLKEIETKKAAINLKTKELKALKVTAKGLPIGDNILSCEQHDIRQTYLKKGDELCKVHQIDKVRTLVNVSEQQIRFLNSGDEVRFKLISAPRKTYIGKINKIIPLGKEDPQNPKHKIYVAEIVVKNTGLDLLPGMKGIAKIYGQKMSLTKLLYNKFTNLIRLDLI